MLMDFIHRHRAGVLLIFLAGSALLLMTLRLTATVTGIKTSLWFLVSPQVVYSGEFFNKVDSLRGRFFQLIHAEGENVILREQNARLARQDVERELLEQENNRLRALLDLKQKKFNQGISAEVIAHDVRDWFQSIVINKGSEEGISVSAAVLTNSKERPVLIGRVSEVKAHTSKVLLISDGVSAVAVAAARGGDIGLLEGRNKPWVVLSYLPLSADVVVGDEIVTAGMGGLFPSGIPVGTVVGISPSKDGFFKEARISPYATAGTLREVLVLERKENSAEKGAMP